MTFVSVTRLRIRAEDRLSKVRHPAPGHPALADPARRLATAVPIRAKGRV